MNNKTNELVTSPVHKSYAPLFPDQFPLSYAEYIWDIARSNSNLSKLFGHIGSILQSEINEKLAQMIYSGSIVFFKDILDNGTARQDSSATAAESSNVYYFSNTEQFGFASFTSPSGTSYYVNFANRYLWTNDGLEPYQEKLYICLSNRRIYAYIGGELVVVGGEDIVIDDELSTTSENPVQNKVISEELNRLQDEIDSIEIPTMRDFEIDDSTGCLMLTEVGRDDGIGFEIDENGYFNVETDD